MYSCSAVLTREKRPVTTHLRSWLTLVCCATFTLPVAAQPKFVARPEGKRVALLVGVKKYKKDELSDLKYPENDINDLASLLKLDGYRRVVVMTQRAGADDPDLLPAGDHIRESRAVLRKGSRREQGPRRGGSTLSPGRRVGTP
jgi:hypothetical protein